ncbi:hypothetical protein [Spiroplasma endosymbiont of Cantharis rufa]|uniref:hypothetical protein n=1 Tax=Spiroplasma endosymbiont of Cantharis rufa TaxID=3066279 RepID=UPI0030D1783D
MKHNGLSGKKIIRNSNLISKENNSNKNFKSVIKILKKNNFPFFPNYQNLDAQNYSYDFIEGTILEKVKTMPIKSTLRIIDIILMYQNFYEKKNGNVIVHGDISPVNIIFNEQLMPIKVIDWDGCYFGSKYDDIGYVCLLWVNFGDDKQEHKKYIEEIKIIFRHLKYKRNDVIAVKLSILKRIEKDNNTILKSEKNSDLDYWLNYTKNWVLKNWEEIEDEFN